ncbi:MAG: LysR family transcriptional regulator [Paracoccus sp. (in: a-proteobacteria)]|uniref:LysR family transcriptional regulator n=1 Tax=Paracoccus sp. TaxID=267 RepID=UPI0026E03177|nr:LysR family transcriptional regulator [Paracoccus sp. (in: a-proteobacteria)]MDO5632862.1 LysR family transcriptional regulator [Paracoccus sp. (in: a-proteobacteria)]
MRNLDIATLRSLQAVAECGTVTRAAEALNMTQSALSMQMRRLDETFGRPMLEKQGRGVVLTEFAQALLGESRRLVAMNDAIIARFTGRRPKGRLRLGFSSDWLHLHVPRGVRSFRQAHPDVDLRMNDSMTRDLLAEFQRGDHDLIVTTEFDCPPGAHHLCKVDLEWFGAVGGQAWRQRPLPMANTQSCAYIPVACAALDQAGIEWVSVNMAGGNDTNRVLTLADLGVNVHPRALSIPGLEVIDHGGALPPLPPTWINIYVTDGPACALATDFATHLRHAIMETCAVVAA